MKNLKLQKIVVAFSIFVLLVSVFGIVSAYAADKYVMKIGHADSLDIYVSRKHAQLVTFKELINARSGGRIEAEPEPGDRRRVALWLRRAGRAGQAGPIEGTLDRVGLQHVGAGEAEGSVHEDAYAHAGVLADFGLVHATLLHGHAAGAFLVVAELHKAVSGLGEDLVEDVCGVLG